MATDKTNPKAVADSSVYLAPTNPNITGNPVANPAPRKVMPKAGNTIDPSIFKKVHPAMNRTSDVYNKYLDLVLLRVVPISILIEIIPPI